MISRRQKSKGSCYLCYGCLQVVKLIEINLCGADEYSCASLTSRNLENLNFLIDISLAAYSFHKMIMMFTWFTRLMHHSGHHLYYSVLSVRLRSDGCYAITELIDQGDITVQRQVAPLLNIQVPSHEDRERHP